MNTLRHMGSWNLLALALALGTSLAVAQEGQLVPETQAPKQAPAVPVAGPSAAPAAAGAGVAQADESPWAKLCTKNEQTGNKQICIIQHGGLDPETGIVLGTAAVRSVEGEDKQALLVGVTTDYSLVIPVGVQIKIDDGEPISLQYVVCFATSCQAQIELTKENFDKMRKGKQMIVAALNMQQHRMGFPVPLTGFGKSYDGPPADNAKYQEAWGQLMEKSRQRKIALANKMAAQLKEQGTQQPQAGAPPQAGAQVPAQPPP
jgi:invasion protein IalB